VKRVGRELGVRYVVQGSVRRGGNRIRITAQLLDAETGGHVWAERFVREQLFGHDYFQLADPDGNGITVYTSHTGELSV
jgi:TolB-like protein